ncbi:MAG: T9SS type A sorting domain-containing protein [Crocinitomicaceae bacterium]|nr:T9SS type A sorting domain-containing protein [Crocinitomicaceae bacterium]
MKKIYVLLGGLMLSGAAMAQSPWTVESYDFAPDDKHAPGAITFIPMRVDNQNQDRANYYTEDFDAGFNGWTAAIQTGTAGFGLTSTGHQNTPSNTYQIPALLSSTPTQWVLLDSDADGTGYTNPEAATLTSPVLDLSAATGQFVAFEFEQFFAEWQPAETADHLYIGVSTDGTTWTEVEISEGVGREARPNPELISWDITDYIVGNESTVYLRFRWEGAWNYGWQIDNVQVNDIPDKDLTIMDTWRTYSSNAGLTYSQVPQAHAEEMVIGAIIRNVGHSPLTNCTFNYEILDPSMSSVSTGTATTTVNLANMEQDSILHATGFVPTTLGTYTVRWSVTSTEGDDNAANDTVYDNHFQLTEYMYAMDYDDGTVTPITGWPLMTSTAFFGNLYDFQQQDVLSGIQFKLANNPSNVGEVVTYGVYRFPDGGSAWEILDEQYNSYTVQSSDVGNLVTINTGGLDVYPNDLYLITVGQLATPGDPLFEKQGDIGWNYIQGRDENGDNRGFFDRLAPIVRAKVIDDVGVEEEASSDRFSVYPNPANEAVNVYISLSGSENTVINVLDISGKVIKTINLGTVEGERTITVSLDEISTGVYFIELVNDNNKQVKKFVKK